MTRYEEFKKITEDLNRPLDDNSEMTGWDLLGYEDYGFTDEEIEEYSEMMKGEEV